MTDNFPANQGWKSVNKVKLIGAGITNQSIANAIPKNIKTMNIVYVASHANGQGVQINDEMVSWPSLVASTTANVNGPVLFIINTCYAGVIRNYISGENAALTICEGSQTVSTYAGGPNNTTPFGFDKVLMDCIQSKYDPNKDGILSLGELYSYTKEEMTKLKASRPDLNLFIPAMTGPDNLAVVIY